MHTEKTNGREKRTLIYAETHIHRISLLHVQSHYEKVYLPLFKQFNRVVNAHAVKQSHRHITYASWNCFSTNHIFLVVVFFSNVITCSVDFKRLNSTNNTNTRNLCVRSVIIFGWCCLLFAVFFFVAAFDFDYDLCDGVAYFIFFSNFHIVA